MYCVGFEFFRDSAPDHWTERPVQSFRNRAAGNKIGIYPMRSTLVLAVLVGAACACPNREFRRTVETFSARNSRVPESLQPLNETKTSPFIRSITTR